VPARRGNKKAQAKIAKLLSRAKRAEGQAAFHVAQRDALLELLAGHPDLLSRALVAVYVAGLRALSDAVPAIAQALKNQTPPLSAEACQVLLESPDCGPRITAALAADPVEAARVAALAPTVQAMEVGRIAAELSAPRKPGSKVPDSLFVLTEVKI
jgi:hypothetical protein